MISMNCVEASCFRFSKKVMAFSREIYTDAEAGCFRCLRRPCASGGEFTPGEHCHSEPGGAPEGQSTARNPPTENQGGVGEAVVGWQCTDELPPPIPGFRLGVPRRALPLRGAAGLGMTGSRFAERTLERVHLYRPRMM